MSTDDSRFPTFDGLVLHVEDSGHAGADLYWSARDEQWFVVDLEDGRLLRCERLVAVEPSPSEDDGELNFVDAYDGPGTPVAMDLDGNGLCFYALADAEEYDESKAHGVVVWDSAFVQAAQEIAARQGES